MVGIEYKIADRKESLEARRFLFKRYSEVGYIKRKQSEGVFWDKHVKNSVYFVAIENNEIIGCSRLIEEPLSELPAISKFKIEEKAKEDIIRIKDKEIAEIGNLTVVPNRNIAIGLYKIALDFSKDNGIRYWVAAIDESFLQSLQRKLPFFRFVYKVIGKKKKYVGSVSVPIMIKLHKVYNIVL